MTDELGFQNFLAAHGAAVYGVVRRYVRDPATADDIYQDACWAAFRGFKTLREHEQPRAWFRTIALRTLINFCRKETRRGPVGEMVREPEAPAAKDPVDEILKDLPSIDRLVLLLHYCEGYSLKDIARELQIPEGTAKTWLHRARASARRSLGSESSLLEQL